MSKENIEAAVTLAEQITNQLFKNSQSIIDDHLGIGYANKNPQLLSTLIETHGQIYVTLLETKPTKKPALTPTLS